MAFTGQNQKGGILTSMLIIIPLIAAVIFISITLRHILTVSSKTRQICRNDSLSAQKEAQRSMTKLLSYNTRAISLESQYQQALHLQKAALASNNAVAIAAAQLRIVMVQGQKSELFFKQEQLKAQHHSKQKFKQMQTIGRMRKSWGNSSLKLSVLMRDYNAIPLAVEQSAFYFAPPYRTQNPLTEKQKNYYRWVLQVEMKLPFLKEQKWIFKQSCTATLKSVAGKPALKMDSVLSKSLL